ncbi:MAG: type II secretion system F family protein [Gammaproteobacteria bacterium]|nr:type II secretion system F family protein [Gammaproteobacteria bacterium]
MRPFYWYGLLLNGKHGRGTLHAPDRHSARQQLSQQQIRPLFLLALPELRPSLSPTQITLFIRQLATLTGSGLTLARALEGIIQGLPKTPLRTLSQQILHELEQGAPFSETLVRRPHLFDPFIIHLIRSGEHAGQLSLLLTRAAEHRDRNHALAHQASRALTYPLGVLLFTLIISAFLLLQIVPQFELLFHNLGGELPPLTRSVLQFAQFIKAQFNTLLLGTLLFVTTLTLLFRRATSFRIGVERLLLSLPFIGSTLTEIMVARLSRTLATLQESGIPIHTGLKISQQMVESPLFQQTIQQIHQSVSHGKTLSQALRAQPLLPPITIQMVQAGEESSALPHMLEQLANYYEQEVEHRLQQFTTLLEPLLILLIGALVGLLAIALYQPIFQIGQQL